MVQDPVEAVDKLTENAENLTGMVVVENSLSLLRPCW